MDGIYELEMKAGPEPGRRYPISRFGTRLGRSSSNDIHWPEGELSRNHCLFEPDGDGVCVIDLASANGTYVNGEQVEGRRPLKPGDRRIYICGFHADKSQRGEVRCNGTSLCCTATCFRLQ
ncbi:MAG: FHA domain-containing protein, partial [Kiritimatiellae bacterium]|nr:FHA domain-containing protein [Kiritimatiellia bacterium]